MVMHVFCANNQERVSHVTCVETYILNDLAINLIGKIVTIYYTHLLKTEREVFLVGKTLLENQRKPTKLSMKFFCW